MSAKPNAVPAAGSLSWIRPRPGHWIRPLAFMAPALVGFAVFFAYPLGALLYYSFTRYDLLNTPVWVGLRNYAFLLTQDPLARKAAYNTVWLVVVITVLRLIFATGVAAVLARIRNGAGLFRTLIYLPALAPPVAATLVFTFLFNPGTGPVNTVLGWVGVKGPLWFSDPAWAKPALTLLTLWVSGELIIILLAGMLDVPAELYEAAGLDGAGSIRRFWHITLPSIAPVLFFGVINSIILGLQYFTQAVVAASVASGSADIAGSQRVIGYPDNSTLTFPVWLYQQGFHYYNMGYASAMSIALFVVSTVFTVFFVYRLRRGSHGEEAA
ncbi:sugar ABC transporter permease [Planotetraspora sp. A-T 1434]|uniref:carbohydrate ABC transporter permease n=1 Tax=Planotetraspora sp. A-T 1434 TaxID=2979219 RepID=UPI0021BF253B|nr:sugar ABC transporter permease [Planotetraspora sp. A-T 1434]MCT9932274.1 sugar ABC transporter permease [Planotetraspora sp. A-T 1434]